jgi:TBC1 domain family member 5
MTTQESSYAAYPLVDEKPPTERPPWEPRTRFEIEKGAAQLRSLQRQLGDSVAWIVDTLLLDDGMQSGENGERMKIVKERKREAIESLAYVRDVLKGIVPLEQVEEDRLLPENELKKRQEQSNKDIAEPTTATSRSVKQGNELSPAEQARATLTSPKPVAKTLPSSSARSSTSQQRSQDYFSIGTSLPRSPPPGGSLAKQPTQQIKQISAPSTPSMSSVLTPNKNAMPLAPWNHTPSSFAPAGSPAVMLPRLPSRPSAVASPRQQSTLRLNSSYRATSQTPIGGDQPPPAVASSSQDPLGVLR